MKFILAYLLLFIIVITSSGQDTLTICYKKNGEKTGKIEKSEYYRKVINNGERYYFQEFLTVSNQLVQETEIKSWEPLIENGKTTYFDKITEQYIATGYYQNGDMSDKWIYKTMNGYDTINYSNAEIKYMPNQSVSPPETYVIVEKMPFCDYGADLKQKRELLDAMIVPLIEAGNIQANPDKYMNLQSQITDINNQAIDRFKAEHLFYPIRAKEKAIQGTVYLKFVVDGFGKIVETKILRGVDKDLDREAVRLINSMDGWTAGTQNGKPVRVAMTAEVKFE
jgi:TonB family protein